MSVVISILALDTGTWMHKIIELQRTLTDEVTLTWIWKWVLATSVSFVHSVHHNIGSKLLPPRGSLHSESCYFLPICSKSSLSRLCVCLNICVCTCMGGWVQVCTWMTHVWKSLDNLKYGSQVPFTFRLKQSWPGTSGPSWPTCELSIILPISAFRLPSLWLQVPITACIFYGVLVIQTLILVLYFQENNCHILNPNYGHVNYVSSQLNVPSFQRQKLTTDPIQFI